MKKIIVVSLDLLMAGWLFAGTYGGGSGTSVSPWEISTKADLKELYETDSDWGSDKYFIQTNDIFCEASDFESGGVFYNAGAGFIPIGLGFGATVCFNYNGQGHVIDGLYVNNSSNGIGFINYTNGAVIKNLGITNADISGNHNVGALIGHATNSTLVENCYASGTVTGSENTGGLAGNVDESTLSRCYSRCSVTGGDHTGGFVGQLEGTINNSYSIGNVSGSMDLSGSMDVGGMVGYVSGTTAVIEKCFCSGEVSANSPYWEPFLGGFAEDADFTVTACYWDKDVQNGSDNTGFTGKTTLEMRDYNTFTTGANAWDFTGTENDDAGTDDIWDMDQLRTVNSGYPILSWQDDADALLSAPFSSGNGTAASPFTVGSLTDLQFISEYPGFWVDHYIQTADIDAAACSTWNDGAGFSPIGNFSTPFEGSYDGNEYGISNLYLNYPGTSRIGLFGCTEAGAEIRDLDLVDITVNDSYNIVGGLVGVNSATISNCSSSGNISGERYIGGLAGENSGSISGSSSSCSINGDGSLGGLVGVNTSTGTITACHSSGSVIGTGTGAGGLAGRNDNLISNCSSSGNVSGNIIVGGFSGANFSSVTASFCSGDVSGVENVGGFVGSIGTDNTKSVSNSYSLGNVTRTSGTKTTFGSFCGWNIHSTIEHCYSIGKVYESSGIIWDSNDADPNSGRDKGFLGGDNNDDGIFIHNFFDKDVSEQQSGLAATAKSTAEMKASWTFRNYGWDFAGESSNGTENIWTIASGDNGGYPALAWQGYSNDGLSTPFVPEVTTSAVSNITTTSASSGGNVLFENGSAVTVKGVCWDTSPNPDINDSKTIDGSSTGTFTSSITGLTAGTTYYLRAYASNSIGTDYGAEQTFTAFYFSGSGTLESPFLIGNLDDLRSLSENSDLWDQAYYFRQTGDIDAAACSTWYEEANGFSPIGNDVTPFNGNYDGGGYAISSLTIMRPTQDYLGLFGCIENAGIDNVHLTDITINNGRYNSSCVGALAGMSSNSTIENCHSSGTVYGLFSVGGLIGWSSESALHKVYNRCSVFGGEWDTGGLLGDMDNTDISNAYSKADVTGAYAVGGLVGAAFVVNSIENCYCSGSVSGAEDVGGLIGYVDDPGEFIVASFWDVETDGIEGNSSGADNYGATGKSTVEMTNATPVNNIYLLAGWDFAGETANGTEDIWNISSELNGGYPFLSWEYPEADVPLPISLVSFSAEVVNGTVHVIWVTESETENAAYRIYRDGEMIAELEGAGTTSEPQSYSWTDQYVVPGKTYSYQLADVSFDGEETKHARVEVEVELELSGKDYHIGAAYPNPFNPVTLIPLNLAKDAVVCATLYDLTGRPMRELQNGSLSAGSHDLKIDGTNLSTGIYFVYVSINDATHVQKIALMK